MGEFIKRPTQLFCRLMGIHLHDRIFMAGRMSVALEVVTVIRTLDEIPSIMHPAESAVVVSVLQTLLRDQGLDGAYELYDDLSSGRRRVFVPVPEPSPSGSVGVDAQRSSSSEHEVLEGVTLPIEQLRALGEVRRSLDDETTSASVELRDEEVEARPNE
jgi:hypothetical protein